ncbi:MAG: hypothetical protein DMD98_15405 [Candidatus Rokuibacteriota bacterium]|nr:MAG: hypothetical protein DMD98_15405 [Candidatus Rokubacteria bacterium]
MGVDPEPAAARSASLAHDLIAPKGLAVSVRGPGATRHPGSRGRHSMPREGGICRSESGPYHRPVKAEWVRDIRIQCAEAGVPFFFKQWGSLRSKSGGRLVSRCSR